MRAFVREHTVGVAAALSFLSLALVFGAVGRVGADLLPMAPSAFLAAIPHANAAISLLAIVTILGGLHAIRDGHVERHRRLMALAFGLFATFLTLYLYRVTLVGPAPFEGPAVLETYLYYPVLGVHIALAIVCLPLLFFVLTLAYAHPVADLPETPHPRVGRVAAVLWLIAFGLGVVVYLLLYAPLWG